MIKPHNIVSFFLILYIAIAAYLAKDLVIVYDNYFEYFFLIAISLIIIIILRYTLKHVDINNNDDKE